VTRRIVVTGSECTGKTTLARRLAGHLGAPWLPEAARGYAIERRRAGLALSAADVEPIARQVIAAEDDALASAPALLVLDTDLISTVVYARHYYGASPAWLEAEARARRGTRYLLCMPDLPWLPDGIRDQPAARETIHQLFRDALAEFGATVSIVSGHGGVRDTAAMAAAAEVTAASGAA
jgi:NadR type nicotinamide-nucleotide adenylyltransferase